MNYNDEHDFSSYETDEDSYNAYKTENMIFNNEKKNYSNNKKHRSGPGKLYLIFLFLAFLITAMSISVAFFTTSARSKVIQEIESAVVNFSLKVEKITNEEKEGLIPVKDDVMLSALKGTNGKQCVDINGNAVCQIYKISVKNDSDYSTSFKSTLELIDQEAGSSLPAILARIEGQDLTPQEEQSFISTPITKADLLRYIYYITPPKLTVALVLAKDMRLNAPETPLYANRHKEQGTLTFKSLHTSAFMIGMTPYSFCKGAHQMKLDSISIDPSTR